MRAWVKRLFPAILSICVLVPCAPIAATAQQRAPGDLLMPTYYKDPRPERLVGFLAEFQNTPAAQNWNAYPPIAGFLAVVFRADPGQGRKLFVPPITNSTAEAFAAGLQLSGVPVNRAAADGIRASLRGMRDAKLVAEFANLPDQLEELKITTPTHLDILWGAAFASGDGKYVAMIVDYFAQAANRSEPIAIDIAKTAIAIMGGPKEIIGELRGRYGDDGARRIIYAATALWAIQSNARQHPFVDRVVVKYITDHPGTPAQKAIVALRPKGT